MKSASGLIAACVLFAGCGVTEPDPVDRPLPPLAECQWLGIAGPETLPAGSSITLGVFRQFCRPNLLFLTNDQVTWSSVDPAVATVSRGVVEAVVPGAAVIQVGFGTLTQQHLIAVTGDPPSPGPGVAALRIYGAPVMVVGQRGFFGAFVVTADRAVVRATAEWQSSAPATANLLDVGGPVRQIDARRAGTARITARSEGRSATFDIVVR
jgi:hypothetical protein